VGHGGLSNVTGGHGGSGHVVDCLLEGSEDGLGGDVEDAGIEDLTVVVDSLDSHLIAEGSDLELVKKSGVGGFNSGSLGNDLLVSNDFNLGLDNLCLNAEGLEERCLLGVETGGTSLNPHIIGGKSADLGGGLSLLDVEDLLDLSEVSIAENDTSVSLEEEGELLELIASNPGILSGFVVFIICFGLLHLVGEGCLHEGLTV
jgi:hypothetical protein